MNQKTLNLVGMALAAWLGISFRAAAQAPVLLNQQGRITLRGTNYSGAGEFKFALVDGTGARTFWRNDGSAEHGEPARGVPLTLVQGLYALLLGDSGLTNMAPIPPLVFTNADVRVRVWFRGDAGAPFALLSPDQRLGTAPYAARSMTLDPSGLPGSANGPKLAPGSITSVELAVEAVGNSALAPGAVTADKVQVSTEWKEWARWTHPNVGVAARSDAMGMAVASLPGGRIGVGVPGDNTVLLFDGDGRSVGKLVPPSGSAPGWFGYAVAGLDGGGIVVGAPLTGPGSVYFMGPDGGALLPPLRGGSNDGWLGKSVAGVGDHSVIVGAPEFDGEASDVGIAYLVPLDGSSPVAFRSPATNALAKFGHSVAAVGRDKVLIGAPRAQTGSSSAGAVYLFQTNGALLRTFTCPQPSVGDGFGWSVAAVGTDRVLIGMPRFVRPGGTFYEGAAFLFHVDGTLLRTFLNPHPSALDGFGIAVAVSPASDEVLVCKRNLNKENENPAAAYVFKTDGTLTGTLDDPRPGVFTDFGSAAAFVGPDRIVIGAPQWSEGGLQSTGAAFLFARDRRVTGLVAESVGLKSVGPDQLRDGAVTAAKLAPNVALLDRGSQQFTGEVNTFVGRVGIGTNSPISPLQVGSARCDGSTWINASDRRLKQDFAPVDVLDVLARVLALPVQSWSYKAQPGHRHLGPVAQDFREAFGLGADDVSIASVDEGGVALAAIQGLHAKLERENTTLRAEVAELRRMVEALARSAALAKPGP